MVITSLTLFIAIMQMYLTLNQKNENKSKSQKQPMTHLGVEFARTSLMTCLRANEPKN
jgi:hypothetical protein